jgi:hypothetical protein
MSVRINTLDELADFAKERAKLERVERAIMDYWRSIMILEDEGGYQFNLEREDLIQIAFNLRAIIDLETKKD